MNFPFGLSIQFEIYSVFFCSSNTACAVSIWFELCQNLRHLLLLLLPAILAWSRNGPRQRRPPKSRRYFRIFKVWSTSSTHPTHIKCRRRVPSLLHLFCTGNNPRLPTRTHSETHLKCWPCTLWRSSTTRECLLFRFAFFGRIFVMSVLVRSLSLRPTPVECVALPCMNDEQYVGPLFCLLCVVHNRILTPKPPLSAYSSVELSASCDSFSFSSTALLTRHLLLFFFTRSI